MAEETTSLMPASLKSFLDRFTPSQKIFIASAIVLSIVGVILIVNIAGSFTYGVLYSNLTTKDSGMILEQLKAKKVPYEISGSGSVIKVPESQVAELRIELAAEGLPEGGGVGFEIFDKTSLSTTDFVQNINYIRATEGELARSITQLREVISAKVHITMPKRSVFVEEQEAAKASVVLRLKPGARISGTNVIPAILHLTAQAVEGLKPDNIAIVDVYGTLLSKPSEGADGDAYDDKQLAFQKKMERSFSQKILSLLEPIVGAGKVRANVRLTLDFNKVQTTAETVDPNSIAKRSEKSDTQSSTGGTVAGGIPGVASNVAQVGAAQGQAASSPSKSKKESSLINYEVSKTVTHTVRPVGEIRQLSAAVVVDDNVKVELVDGELQRDVQKRTPEELTALRRVVQAAIGFNQARGDVVEVVNLSFDNSAATESDYMEEKQRTRQLIDDAVKYGGIALGVLLVFFLIVRPVAKKIVEIFKNIGKPRQEEIEIPKIDGEKMSALQEARDDAEIERELVEQYKVPKASKKMGIIKQKVIEFAEDNLEETASLVRSFLVED